MANQNPGGWVTFSWKQYTATSFVRTKNRTENGIENGAGLDREIAQLNSNQQLDTRGA